jgi:hypothetical protein
MITNHVYRDIALGELITLFLKVRVFFIFESKLTKDC